MSSTGPPGQRPSRDEAAGPSPNASTGPQQAARPRNQSVPSSEPVSTTRGHHMADTHTGKRGAHRQRKRRPPAEPHLPNAPSRISPWMSTTFDAHRCADGVRPAASPSASTPSCPGARARSKTRRDSSFLILHVRGGGRGVRAGQRGGTVAQPGATGQLGGGVSDHCGGRSGREARGYVPPPSKPAESYIGVSQQGKAHPTTPPAENETGQRRAGAGTTHPARCAEGQGRRRRGRREMEREQRGA